MTKEEFAKAFDGTEIYNWRDSRTKTMRDLSAFWSKLRKAGVTDKEHEKAFTAAKAAKDDTSMTQLVEDVLAMNGCRVGIDYSCGVCACLSDIEIERFHAMMAEVYAQVPVDYEGPACV